MKSVIVKFQHKNTSDEGQDNQLTLHEKENQILPSTQIPSSTTGSSTVKLPTKFVVTTPKKVIEDLSEEHQILALQSQMSMQRDSEPECFDFDQNEGMAAVG